MKDIPEIGKEYHFFDEGKTSPSRHYICRCERVIPFGESKSVVLETEDSSKSSLYDIWKEEVVKKYLDEKYTK